MADINSKEGIGRYQAILDSTRRLRTALEKADGSVFD